MTPVELPRCLLLEQGLLPELLPRNDRLVLTFAQRATHLPPETRTVPVRPRRWCGVTVDEFLAAVRALSRARSQRPRCSPAPR